jgi:hypothetical protein
MNKLFKWLIASSALAAALTLSGTALAYQAPKEAPAKAKAAAKAAAMPAPSESDIADAKAKGLVWVNTNSKVYHKEGEFYGKTKQGKFMTEADAQKAGYRAAKTSPIGKKKSPPAKK